MGSMTPFNFKYMIKGSDIWLRNENNSDHFNTAFKYEPDGSVAYTLNRHDGTLDFEIFPEKNTMILKSSPKNSSSGEIHFKCNDFPDIDLYYFGVKQNDGVDNDSSSGDSKEYESDILKVSKYHKYGSNIDIVEIQSLIDEVVRVEKVIVNKGNCRSGFSPETANNINGLNYGDVLKVLVFPQCEIIRIDIETDKGDFNYYW